MAAKVAQSTQGGSGANEVAASSATGTTEQGQGGISYASVLNPRNSDNNKENISDITQSTKGVESTIQKGKSSHPRSNPRRYTSHYGRQERHYPSPSKPNNVEVVNRVEGGPDTPDTPKLNNGEAGSDSEFQTVAPKSARRKEKHRESHRDHHDHRDRYHHRERYHQRSQQQHDAGDDRPHKERGEKNASADHTVAKEVAKDKEEAAAEQDEESEPVRYVEAPIPVVNPWTKSKGGAARPPQPPQAQPAPATSQVNPPPPAVSVVDKPLDKPLQKVATEKPVLAAKEKRVLQPQQQKGKIGKLCVRIKYLNFVYL